MERRLEDLGAESGVNARSTLSALDWGVRRGYKLAIDIGIFVAVASIGKSLFMCGLSH